MEKEISAKEFKVEMLKIMHYQMEMVKLHANLIEFDPLNVSIRGHIECIYQTLNSLENNLDYFNRYIAKARAGIEMEYGMTLSEDGVLVPFFHAKEMEKSNKNNTGMVI